MRLPNRHGLQVRLTFPAAGLFLAGEHRVADLASLHDHLDSLLPGGK